jgi:hypothetical protein
MFLKWVRIVFGMLVGIIVIRFIHLFPIESTTLAYR